MQPAESTIEPSVAADGPAVTASAGSATPEPSPPPARARVGDGRGAPAVSSRGSGGQRQGRGRKRDPQGQRTQEPFSAPSPGTGPGSDHALRPAYPGVRPEDLHSWGAPASPAGRPRGQRPPEPFASEPPAALGQHPYPPPWTDPRFLAWMEAQRRWEELTRMAAPYPWPMPPVMPGPQPPWSDAYYRRPAPPPDQNPPSRPPRRQARQPDPEAPAGHSLTARDTSSGREPGPSRVGWNMREPNPERFGEYGSAAMPSPPSSRAARGRSEADASFILEARNADGRKPDSRSTDGRPALSPAPGGSSDPDLPRVTGQLGSSLTGSSLTVSSQGSGQADSSQAMIPSSTQTPRPQVQEISDVAMMVVELIKGIAFQPDEVWVTELEGRNSTVIEVHVAEADHGRMLGRSGRVASALREVLFALGGKRQRRYSLQFIN